jgi:hypothetical protein
MSEALRTFELPAAALAVIKEGVVKPKARSLAEKPDASLSSSEATASSVGAMETASSDGGARSVDDSEVLPAQAARGTKARSSRDSETEPMSVPLSASITVRLPHDIPGRVLRASTDRRIARLRPCTQQEIVAEALGQWLKRNGY